MYKKLYVIDLFSTTHRISMSKGLSVRELLKKTYDNLAKRNEHQQIVLTEGSLAEIANDSDWHRTRIGYMKYERANLFQFNNKNWAVARGEKYGDYPAEPYDSDLSAFELLIEDKTPGKIQEKLRSVIRGNSYFRNSLIYGLNDGRLAIGPNSDWFSNPFRSRMAELLKPRIDDFVLQKPEYDTRFILASTLQYPATKVTLYKPNFVDFLTETIETVLKENVKTGDE
jgi:hypothetical protein